MSKITVNQISKISYPLYLYKDDILLATGTAFIYQHNNQHYVITNKHNFSGRSIHDNNVISNKGAIPNRAKLWIDLKETKLVDGVVKRQVQEIFFDLWKPFDNTNSVSAWFSHSEDKIDVAAQLVRFDTNLNIYEINNSFSGENKYYSSAIVDDVVIVGFPQGIVVEKNSPIWKKGIIASEPGYTINNLPKYYIDATTTQGMSGSPVFTVTYPLEGDLDQPNKPFYLGRQYNFIGIYSGRVFETNKNSEQENQLNLNLTQEEEISKKLFRSQLGIVWKKSAMEDMVHNIQYRKHHIEDNAFIKS